LGLKSKVVDFVNFFADEKVPYPPAYTEIYPAVPVVEVGGPSAPSMGWQQPDMNLPQQPPVYVTQPPGQLK
jgi:hypothetical protein